MNVRNHSQSLERLISPHSYSTHCSIFHRPSPDNHRLNVRTSDRCLPSSLHLPAVQILTKAMLELDKMAVKLSLNLRHLANYDYALLITDR